LQVGWLHAVDTKLSIAKFLLCRHS
jgi:hypothetical protein